MNEDFSDIFEKLNINKDSISPEMINNVMNMLKNNVNDTSGDSNESSQNTSIPDIDMETILKIKTVMDKMKKNSNNPRAKLLNDLKPYLDNNKRNKLEQCMKIDKMIELLPLIGGDVNTRLYNDDSILLISLIALLF